MCLTLARGHKYRMYLYLCTPTQACVHEYVCTYVYAVLIFYNFLCLIFWGEWVGVFTLKFHDVCRLIPTLEYCNIESLSDEVVMC